MPPRRRPSKQREGTAGAGSSAAPRRTREEWLEAALEVLSREGEGRIRVRQIAAALGVTTGSFYWHFQDRADFLEQLLAWWVKHYTTDVATLARSLPGTPRERLKAIATKIIQVHAARYDIAVRAWAAHESGAAEAVRASDAIRIRTVGGLFREMGFRGQELTLRTRTFVTFTSLHSAVGKPQSERVRIAQLHRLIDLLSQHAPGRASGEDVLLRPK